MAIRKEIEDFKQTRMKELLSKCTTGQQTLFHRMFPNGPKQDQMISAIELIERTLDNDRLG